MKVIVIGLGSMGKRRIRLMKDEYPDIEIIGVDAQKERQDEVKKMFDIETLGDLDDAVSLATVAFVCTSPLSHGKLINKCLKAGMDVFTEINLVSDEYEENIRIAKEKQKVLFLSSTFLYREEIKFIKENVWQQKKALDYIYHVGQYLPDWHPWEQVSDFFVSEKRTNGCREIFAIELPWLVSVFGDILSIQVKKDEITSLQLGYSDNYLVMIEHKNGNKGIFAVDVATRKSVRNLEIYGEDLYLSWDGTPEGLIRYNINLKQEERITLYESIEHESGYSVSIIENAYRSEIKTFFEMVNERKLKNEIHDFEKDECILKWIDQIEE